MPKDKDPYPKPRKGDRLKCLACSDGWVWTKSGKRICKACLGKGYIVV